MNTPKEKSFTLFIGKLFLVLFRQKFLNKKNKKTIYSKVLKRAFANFTRNLKSIHSFAPAVASVLATTVGGGDSCDDEGLMETVVQEAHVDILNRQG